METWIIYKLTPYSIPKIQQFEVQAFDINSAILNSGIPITEIIAIKLKIITECVVGI